MTDRIELLLEAERRGLLPSDKQALLDEARKRGMVDQRNNFAEAIQTAPPEPKGTIYGPTFGRASEIESRPGYGRVLLSGAFGNDQDLARNIGNVIPGASVVESEGGRPLIRLENGDTFEVNPEGFDPGDLLRFGTKAASFLPASRLAGGVPGLAGRTAAGAGLSAATEAGTQVAVGRESIDPVEVGFAAGGGGLGELAAPLVGALFRGSTQRMPRAEAVRRARVILGERINDMPEEAAAQIGRRLDEIELGGSPDDLIGEAEFGLQYTRGQRTGDLPTLMREERLSQSPTMLDVQRQNVDAANRAVTNVARRVAGGEVDTAPGAVARAREAVRAEERTLRGQVNNAYDRFRDTTAVVGSDASNQLPLRVSQALSDFNVDPINTPGATRALEIINKTFGGEGQGAALSARKIDQTRRQIRSIGGSSTSDKRVVTKIINEMDGWLDEAVEQGLVSGDPKAIEFLKEARKLNTDLARRFGESGMGKDVDRIVAKMLRNDASADELARMIYGATQVSAPIAGRALARVRFAMRDRPQEWDQLRAQVLRSAVTGKGDSPLGIQAIHSNLKELLVNRPEMMKTLFNPGELQTVQRLTAALEPLLRTVDKRSSGTTERMMRVMAPYVTKFPVIRQLFDYGGEAMQASAAQRALSPLAPPRKPGTPAVVAGIGAFAAPYLNPQDPSNGR